MRSFPDGRPLGPRLRLQRLRLPPGGTVATISPQKAPPLPAPSRPEPTAQDASPLLIPRNRPARRTSDARRRRSDRFVRRGEPHPEAHASRSRPIRSRIAANSFRGHRHLRQLEDDVLGVDDHLGPDLDQLLPQRRQRPALDRLRQHQLPQEVGQVVRQGEQLQPRRVMLAPSRRSECGRTRCWIRVSPELTGLLSPGRAASRDDGSCRDCFRHKQSRASQGEDRA